MNQFNATEVKCNGVGGYGYQAALKHKSAITDIVNEVRHHLGLEAIWQKVIENNPNDDFHQGHRFLEVDSNVSRLVTGLANYCYSYLKSEELVEMHLGAVLNNLTFE